MFFKVVSLSWLTMGNSKVTFSGGSSNTASTMIWKVSFLFAMKVGEREIYSLGISSLYSM
jgi:hypothetical protein